MCRCSQIYLNFPLQLLSFVERVETFVLLTHVVSYLGLDSSKKKKYSLSFVNNPQRCYPAITKASKLAFKVSKLAYMLLETWVSIEIWKKVVEESECLDLVLSLIVKMLKLNHFPLILLFPIPKGKIMDTLLYCSLSI